jgi:hypothetical protein
MDGSGAHKESLVIVISFTEVDCVNHWKIERIIEYIGKNCPNESGIICETYVKMM